MKEEVFNKKTKTHRYTGIDYIDIDLEDSDILRIADVCSKLNEKKIKLEAEFKHWSKRKKEEIAAVNSELDTNFDKINTRSEVIEDEIEILKDYENGIVSRFYKNKRFKESTMTEFDMRNIPPQLEVVSEFANQPIVTQEDGTQVAGDQFGTATKNEPKECDQSEQIAFDSMQSSRDAQDHPVSVNQGLW